MSSSFGAIGTPVRNISAPRGTDLTCKGWPQEAAFRMLQNNLDPEVAENPDELVVYGSGKAPPRAMVAAGSVLIGIATSASAMIGLPPIA